ncbi:MAG: hypothetical protein AAF546_08815 [Verrucomicrobiota bacterium]
MNNAWKRPQTAAKVAIESADAESFGRNLRDWQHELRKVSSRKEFAKRIAEAPILIAEQNGDHGQSDAYLAAYVEWLCERNGIETPEWVDEPERIARKAWFDLPSFWQDSFVYAPGPFRRRGVFTRPDDVLNLRRGRPSVSAEQKRKKGVERQRRYRARIRAKLEKLKQLEGF